MATLAQQIAAAKQLYNTTGLNILGTNVHRGSWGGLPDLGVTEALAYGGSGGTTQDLSNALAGYPVSSTGQVYGETATPTVKGAATSTGNNLPGGQVPTNQVPVNAPTNQTPSQDVQNREEQIRGEISGGYDAYLADLQELYESGFDTQKTAQLQMVENQLASGKEELGAQKEMGVYDLEKEAERVTSTQARNLRDLAANITNQMRAGNIYLGSRGAGDSSAANQYSYALTKLGTRARSDLMNKTSDLMDEIAGRKFKLNTMYNTEINKLQRDADTKKLELMSWYSEQANNIRLMIAQGGLNKQLDLANVSKSLLDEGLRRLAAIQDEQTNRRAALTSWVLSNSATLSELKKNFEGIAEYQAPELAYNPMAGNLIAGQGQSPSVTAYGGYAGNIDEEDLFS